MRARAFARCETCTHAGVLRVGAECPSCGGPTATRAAPADLFSGWRCQCYQCTWTPC